MVAGPQCRRHASRHRLPRHGQGQVNAQGAWHLGRLPTPLDRDAQTTRHAQDEQLAGELDLAVADNGFYKTRRRRGGPLTARTGETSGAHKARPRVRLSGAPHARTSTAPMMTLLFVVPLFPSDSLRHGHPAGQHGVTPPSQTAMITRRDASGARAAREERSERHQGDRAAPRATPQRRTTAL